MTRLTPRHRCELTDDTGLLMGHHGHENGVYVPILLYVMFASTAGPSISGVAL